MIKSGHLLGLGVVAAVVLGLWVWKRGGVGPAAQAVGAGAVNAAGGVITGAVGAVGAAVGVPATDMTECQRALAEGRTWDASFACPAGTFLGSIFGSNKPAATVDGAAAGKLAETERAYFDRGGATAGTGSGSFSEGVGDGGFLWPAYGN